MSDPSESITDLNIYCPECDYNLTGSTGDRCPWCGWEIDVDVLASYASDRPGVRRAGAIITSLVFGLGSMIAAASLIFRASVLLPTDWIAVMGVGIASIGHLVLAGMSITCGPHWPMRRTEAANMIRLAAWLSIVTCVIGATSMLYVAPTTRIVRGVKVNGALEFCLAAFLFTLPGVTLLMMRLISFRTPPCERKKWDRKTDSLTSGQVGRAPFMIEVGRRYTCDQITQQWGDQIRTKNAAVEAAIAQSWEIESVLAKEQNRPLYNNDLVRLNSLYEAWSIAPTA